VKIALTGIKPTGEIHLGNYIGSIEPLLNLHSDIKYFFIADYHSLINHPKPEILQKNIFHVACVLLSFFNESKNTFIYRQSKIKETFELNVILTCFMNKGFLNRAHAYKSIVEKNIENGSDADKGVFMGLYTYPILMAADILIMQPDIIPVGKDQKQHIEIMKEISRKINYFYKNDILNIPEGSYNREILLNGVDGRKMSKSYNNTIPLFLPDNKLKKMIFSIPTNSKNVGESKFESESEITSLYKAFSSNNEYEVLLKMMNDGASWGEVKSIVYEKLITIFKDAKEKYNYFLNNEKEVFDILYKNEEHISSIANDNLKYIKNQIGI